MPKIFGREPTLIIGFVAAVLVFLGTQNISGLSPEQAALWIVLLNAVAGVINALTVRPVSPAAFTYLVGAAVALAAAYGFDFSVEAVGGLNALVIAGLALIVRGEVSPENTPVSSSTGHHVLK